MQQNGIDKASLFCQKCGEMFENGKCAKCEKENRYKPYENLLKAVSIILHDSKGPLPMRQLKSIIKQTTKNHYEPSTKEIEAAYQDLEDILHHQIDSRGKRFTWDRPFELPNLAERVKPLGEGVYTPESYAEQRNVSKKVAKKELDALIKSKRANVCKIDSETLYATNVKVLLHHVVNLKPGLNDLELATLMGSKDQYVLRRLRELTKEGLVYAEKPSARRWVGRYKWYAVVKN